MLSPQPLRIISLLSVVLSSTRHVHVRAAPVVNSLRANNAASASSDSSEDIPDVIDTRRALVAQIDDSSEDIPDVTDTRRSLNADHRDIPQKCLNLLAASSNARGQIRKEDYYTLTEGMANGYFEANGMNSFSDLPLENKHVFVTQACKCKMNGGRDNCCQGNRARINVKGLDAQNPELMDEDVKVNIYDICSTTSVAIGENKLPETGEGPYVPPSTTSTTTTLATTTSATTTVVSGSTTVAGGSFVPPTEATSTAATPNAIEDGNGNGDTDRSGGGDEDKGLTTSAKAGIGVASAVGALVLLAALFLGAKRRKQSQEQQEDEAAILAGDDEMLKDDLNGMVINSPRDENDDQSNAVQTAAEDSYTAVGTTGSGDSGEQKTDDYAL